MLGNFFRRSSDHKQRVNKKQNVEINSTASSGGQGEYMKYVSFSWSQLKASLSIFNISLSQQFFDKEIIKKDISINAKSRAFQKKVHLENILSVVQ